jgi:glycosyltransferase involved in cell wall biosynthesis
MKLSVCIATYNGEKYIKEQINSILIQLNKNDEIIIGDDGSTDSTLEILKSYNDPRIKIYNNSFQNLILNFESTISRAKGDYIFLADQDDVWLPNRIENSLKYLIEYDIVVSNCKVVNEYCEIIHESFFELNKSKKGLISNLISNSYLGCCLAFRKSILKKVLPFPKNIPMHDIWIGFVSELFYKVKYDEVPVMLYRRHGQNESSTGDVSKYSFLQKVKFRLFAFTNIFNLIRR